MKKFIQKIIIKLYWKFNCHTIESFASQLVVYAIPAKISKMQMTSILGQVTNNINEQNRNYEFKIKPIAGCVFPEKKIEIFDNLDINKITGGGE